MQTDLDICNSALDELGVEPIDSLVDENKRARLCNRNYESIKKKMIRDHPWNFAIKRLTLEAESSVFATTDVTILADTITVTAHGKSTGQRVLFKPFPDDGTTLLPETLLSGSTYFLIVVDVNTYKVADSLVNANAGTAIDLTSVGTGDTSIFYSPVFHFDYQADVPSDYLKIIETENYRTVEWQIEGAKFVSNAETVNIRYVANVVESLFDIHFAEAVAKELAAKMAFSLIQDPEIKVILKEEALALLRTARSMDAQQGTPQSLDATEWLLARNQSSLGIY